MAGSSPTNHWKLGLFVTLGFAACLLTLGWIGAERLRRETIEIYYYFDEEVSGLDVGAPVQFRGVRIGKVSNIRAAPDRRHVEVTADIYVDALEDMGLSMGDALGEARAGDEPFMPNELRAQLRSSLLTGVTFIQTDFFDVGRYPVPRYPFEVPWNTVHTAPSAYKSIEAGMLDMTNRLPELTAEAHATLSALRGEIEGSNLADLSGETRRLMTTLTRRLEEVEQLELLPSFRDTLETSTTAFREVGALAADLRGEDGPLLAAARSWHEAGAILAEVLGDSDLPTTMLLLRELALEMSHASAELAALAYDTRRDLEGLRATLDSIRRLAELIERDPASLLHGRGAPHSLPEVR